MNNRPRPVLLVDDDYSVRLVTGQLLIYAGYNVETAASASEAVRRLQEQCEIAPFEVVITDLHMPGMGGHALHEEIGARWPALTHRIILMTGDLDDRRHGRPYQSTPARVLAKPVTRAVLIEAVNAALEDRPTVPSERA